jgi:hypothetical protein
MKSTAVILLFFFSLLTVQPLLSIASASHEKESCTMSCCAPHKEKKAPAPMKGMCGDLSCNPFGEYACCTGFIVSNKTHFSFTPQRTSKNIILYTQFYTSHFDSDCWRPPENTVSILG